MPTIAEPPKPISREDNPGLSSWMKGLPPMEAQAGSVSPLQPSPAATPAAPVLEAEPAPNTPPLKPVVTEPEPAKPAVVAEDESKWPRSAKDWDAFKSKRKEKEEALAKERDDIKTERDRLNEEIKVLKGQGPSPELETLKKERDEYEQQLRLHAVEKHPKFVAYFENKTKAQVELAKRIVGTENADSVAKILSLTEGEYRDAKIEELAGNLTVLQSSRLAGVVNALSEINTERSSEIAKARENYDKLQTEQKTAGERAQAESAKAAQDAVNDLLAKTIDPKTGSFLFQKKEGDEAWNKEVDARIAGFKHLSLGNATREERVKACRDAVAFPALVKYAQERDAEVVSLKAQVKALSAAGPTVAASEAAPAADAQPARFVPRQGLRPMDVTKGFAEGMRAARGV